MVRRSYFLFLSDTSLSLWQSQAGQIQQEASYSANAEGVAAFSEFATKATNAHWYILFDLQEEDCRVETVPHVNARDRRKLIDRRLTQLYRASQYYSTAHQGREEGGRRDDRILFTAVSNPVPLDMWLEVLVKQEAFIVGIYSVSLLTAQHAHRITGLPPRVLIISRQNSSGLRQTYLADGAMRFSRLTVLEEDSVEGQANQLAAESARARQFLASLRAIERTEVLHIVMLCSEAEQSLFREACPDSELIHYSFLPMQRLADALHVSCVPNLRFAEPIWLAYLARKHPKNQYAPIAQRKPYVAWQVGRALYVFAVLIVLFGLFAGHSYWDASRQLDLESLVFAQRQAKADLIYNSNVPPQQHGSFTPSGMKNVVQAYRQLVEKWPNLGKTLVEVSQVFNNYAMFELDQIDWEVSTSPIPRADDTEAPPPTAPATEPEPGAPAVDAQRYIIMQFRGHLLEYEDRYRQALDLGDALVLSFAIQTGDKAEIVQLPLDTKSESKIEFNSEQGPDIQGAPLAVRIIRPLRSTPAAEPTP
ncbi:hypothetical protein [Chitinimonas sp. BJB300]|uniref:hypothetical protein n=1 Tax=Chitinimonas sp. BJB300 TaxID=1559339 RepID=UPI000C0ED621|nr:hypothetical protein [Chitinimonas sp. BJB300]PHV11071.1 hypothetical protein CSQ89_12860 [Chitinimonas sp. BJB300]TSJ91522.1 hypothetical protein FG002_004425 [Chitinimonas sp. BJB300]